MPSRSTPSGTYAFEFALLICLALALPMFEGLKNWLWGAYGVTWLANRMRAGPSWQTLGGPWDRWDSVLLTWLGGAVVGAAFAGMQHDQWRGAVDTLRITSMLWLLKRSGYAGPRWVGLHVALQVSASVATVWALAALRVPHAYEGIQLRSVGHVNHSAIYLAICFGALLGGACAYWRTLRPWLRALAAGEFALLLAGLFAAGSRAGTATVVLGALAFGALWLRLRRSWRALAWIAVAVLAYGAAVAWFDTDMRRKHELAAESDYPLINERYPIWQQALATWRAYPVFGIGADNSKYVDAGDVARWQAARGAPYDAATFLRTSHAHSLYLNTLAERGLWGAALLAMLLVAWAGSVVCAVPRRDAPPLAWLLWSGAAAALFVVAVLGVVNTTFHDEHGLLAALMLGAWLGGRPREAKAPAA
jgi:O-antigen ligase